MSHAIGHDPLCPMSEGCMCAPHPDGCASCDCDCEFIAKVREDQRKIDEKYYLNSCMFCGFDDFSTHVCDECLKEWEDDE